MAYGIWCRNAVLLLAMVMANCHLALRHKLIVQRSWLVLVVCVVFTSGDTMLQLFLYEAVLMASMVCLIVFNPTELVVVFVTLAALLNSMLRIACLQCALQQCYVWLTPQMVLLSQAAALVWVPLGDLALVWLW